MPSNRLLVVTYIDFLIVDTLGYIPKPLRFFFFFLRCIARMKASSCLSKTSGGVLACRSVSKLCLSNPPMRLNSAMVFKSVWAAILPPKKRRRIYSDRDSPAISVCSVRRVFSLSVTRMVPHFRAALRPPSSVFLSFMPWSLECEKRSVEYLGSPEGVSLLAGW